MLLLVPVSLVLSGSGNLALWPAPEVAWPEGSRGYAEGVADRPGIRAGLVSGTKRFRYVVIPDSSGTLSLPDIQYAWYDHDRRAWRDVEARAVVLPVMGLIVSASVLGSEIDDGTAVHILAKPLPRRDIVLSKLVVAATVTTVTVGAGMLLAGLIAGSGRLGLGLLAGTALGAIAYSALFLALSLLTRRPVLVGLVYILVWEGLLGNVVAGTRVLSIQQYVIAVSERAADTTLFTGNLSVPVALVMAAVLTVATTVLAIDRLRCFAVTGDTS